MRHLSIARLMGLVALLGINFAALKMLLPKEEPSWPLHVAGFLPLLDIQLIALYVTAGRFRVAIRRRPAGRFWPAMAAACFPTTLAAGILVAFAPGLLIDYVELAFRLFARVLLAAGISTTFDSSFERWVVLPAVLGVAISGPLIVLAIVLAVALRRFRLVVTPRAEEPCAATPSSPSSS